MHAIETAVFFMPTVATRLGCAAVALVRFDIFIVLAGSPELDWLGAPWSLGLSREF